MNFVPIRAHSSPMPVFPPHMESNITPADKILIEQSAAHPELRCSIGSIAGYIKSRLESAITKEVLDTFAAHGVFLFGSKVKDAKTYILNFLESHPELRDADATRCFTKIQYFVYYCHQAGIPIN